MNAPLTPLSFLARSVFVYPDKTAVVDGARRFTYREFDTRVTRLAAALRSAGVEPGDRVAVLAQNSTVSLEPHFAVPLLGAILVMLNTRLQPAEHVWILNHCQAKVLIADEALLAPLLPYLDDLPHVALATSEYEAMIDRAAASFAGQPEPDEDSVISINYTSGTTGFPKGVMHTHRGAWINAIGEILEFGLRADSVYLWTLPMFHCNGWNFPWAVTGAGSRHVCMPRPDPEHAVELIAREGVTHLCGAPVVINNLAQHCLRRGIVFRNGLRIVTAGAPPSPAMLRAATEIGADIQHVYGLTETYGPHTICAWRREWDADPLEERALRKSRQGVPYVIAGT